MPLAIAVGVAGIASAGASIYGASSAASAAKKAAAENQAAITKTQAANNALFSPYVQRGNAAGDAINALLGIGTGSTPGSAQSYSDYLAANPDIASEANRVTADGEFSSVGDYLKWHDQNYAGENRASYTDPSGATGSANAAFNNYLNSTGHQFRLQTGTDAIDANKATSGLLRSGATLKAVQQYGQNIGTQDFQGYVGDLQTQQGVGLSAASGNAGSNSSILSATTNNNNTLADNTGNAALAGANGVSNALSSAVNAYSLYSGLQAKASGASSYGTHEGAHI